MKIKLEKKHGGSKKNRKQETNRQSPKTMSFGENMKKEALQSHGNGYVGKNLERKK